MLSEQCTAKIKLSQLSDNRYDPGRLSVFHTALKLCWKYHYCLRLHSNLLHGIISPGGHRSHCYSPVDQEDEAPWSYGGRGSIITGNAYFFCQVFLAHQLPQCTVLFNPHNAHTCPQPWHQCSGWELLMLLVPRQQRLLPCEARMDSQVLAL